MTNPQQTQREMLDSDAIVECLLYAVRPPEQDKLMTDAANLILRLQAAQFRSAVPVPSEAEVKQVCHDAFVAVADKKTSSWDVECGVKYAIRWLLAWQQQQLGEGVE